MKAFYSKPISTERFNEYISRLQGGTQGDLALPISGFNPMAKNHILEKIKELEELEAEALMEETITTFNSAWGDATGEEFLVVLNIADDLAGGWTNYYSTDFDSKFKLNAFVYRKFSVPYFWTSESYARELIKTRTLAYLGRTLYRTKHPQPTTLEEHVKQEIFVANITENDETKIGEASCEAIEAYYLKHQLSDEYHKIFNFFYGDQGSDSLGYPKFGNTGILGFDYAKIIAKRSI